MSKCQYIVIYVWMILEFISDNKKHFCLIYIEVNTNY